ncbi:MAG: hypothetical protein U1F77_13190 [Kiritimatiellia bacterium]
MAKKRPAKHDEVMLIPFLDILCSLIGVLILIIVVLCVAQTQRARGRTKEEIQLSQKYQSLVRQRKDLEKEVERRKANASAAEKLRMEREAREKKLEQDPRTNSSGWSSCASASPCRRRKPAPTRTSPRGSRRRWRS